MGTDPKEGTVRFIQKNGALMSLRKPPAGVSIEYSSDAGSVFLPHKTPVLILEAQKNSYFIRVLSPNGPGWILFDQAESDE